MTIWRMRVACWIPKATDTHSEYVILTAFQLQQWVHEGASIFRYTYIDYLPIPQRMFKISAFSSIQFLERTPVGLVSYVSSWGWLPTSFSTSKIRCTKSYFLFLALDLPYSTQIRTQGMGFQRFMVKGHALYTRFGSLYYGNNINMYYVIIYFYVNYLYVIFNIILN